MGRCCATAFGFRVVSVTVVLAWSALSASAGDRTSRCTVSGDAVDLDAVVVRAPGTPPFTLVVRLAAVQATPRTRGDATRVRVSGALVFDGVSDAVPYRLTARTSAAGGMLSLSTDTDLDRVRSVVVTSPAKAAGVPSSAAAAQRSLTVDVGMGFGMATVRRLSLPCSAVSLGGNLSPDAPVEAQDDGTFWRPAADSGRLVFRSKPGAGARVVVTFAPGASLRRLAKVRKWYRLQFVGGDGSVVTGWVDRKQLVATEFISLAGLREPVGDLVCGSGGETFTPGVRLGQATVDPGTRVFVAPALPDNRAWATFTQGTVLARRVGDEAWTQLIRVPGVATKGACRELEQAWVPSAAVHFASE